MKGVLFLKGKTKYWMLAAVAYIAFACIFPEAVKPKYSPELEENAIIRMQIFSDKHDSFLLMPENTLYYIEEGDIGKREPGVYIRDFMKPPCIYAPQISIIQRVKLTKEQIKNIDELMYQVILEKTNEQWWTDSVDIDAAYYGVRYHSRYTALAQGGALENLYLLFCDLCGVTDLPDPSQFGA